MTKCHFILHKNRKQTRISITRSLTRILVERVANEFQCMGGEKLQLAYVNKIIQDTIKKKLKEDYMVQHHA